MHQLYGIAFSHYVEKARWALDRFGVPYRDRRYLPFVHMVALHHLHRGRQNHTNKISSRYSTPVLITPGGGIVPESAAIVRYVSERFARDEDGLYPTPEVDDLEQRFHDALGPHTRRAAYGFLFERPDLLRRVVEENVSLAQARLFRVARPIAVRGLRRVLAIDEAGVARSMDKTRREFAWVSERLTDGRDFLVGSRFSAADLAFAALAAPALLPSGYSAWLPEVDALPARARALTRELRDTPAGRFALGLYESERRRVMLPR